MHLENYLDFHAEDVIRLKGHRIGLEHIVERYHEGYSPEQMALEYPGVSLEQIYGVLAYYLHHQAQVDAYIVRIDAAAEARYQEWAATMPALSQRIRALITQRQQERAAP
ncbi:DUF433 domain-containing protein [Candidatus Chloroploca sp. M-50]|uniref:DUF433 domain-containing protein n=1 Tax=Candidatus Chloroploca mongolica TaxID=2528176 RepID=A0ABS4DA12_9CHLR|nr:DUF433 domain-containing protein [Candidatus Chloroploca mongolica]MBP1466271.1 DUF433 domain-containing protein [Candidatus Chloroploca mongolica]NCC34449.1 DUF433 domain-containing protein [Chloroflexia bacterium]